MLKETLPFDIVSNIRIRPSKFGKRTNPDKIVIGGGVSRAGNTWLELLKGEFARFAFPRVYQGVEIVTATLGNNAGVIGGAWLAKDRLAKLNDVPEFHYNKSGWFS